MTEKRFTYLNTNGWNKDGFLNTMNGLNEKNKKLQKENEQLKRDNELLSDELEQCKAVIDNRWKEYLDKKGDLE